MTNQSSRRDGGRGLLHEVVPQRLQYEHSHTDTSYLRTVGKALSLRQASGGQERCGIRR